MSRKTGKKSLRYYIKIYILILGQTLKSKMSYKEDFFISIIGMLAVNIGGFLSFWLVFQNFPSIGAWNYYEMLFLYAFSLIALTPCQCIFENNWMLSLNVFKGDFIRYCFRPVNIFFYYISEEFDLKGIGQLIFGIALMVYSINKLDLHFSAALLLLLIIQLISASLFPIAIMNLVASFSFWVIHTGPLMLLVNKLHDYSKYPNSIFNGFFRFIFTYVIPIAFVAYYPSLLFLKREEVTVLTFLTPFLGIICVYISYRIWMKGALQYNGTGS